MTIKTTDCKGDKATYKVRTGKEVVEQVKKMMEFGTKCYGDKIVEITIRRGR